jgi:hypothetical protein
MNRIYRTAYIYVDACCFSLSAEEFETILADYIVLQHQTNNEPPFHAQGKHAVSALFKKYVFENTSNVDVKNISISLKERGVLLQLVVEEDKHEFGKINRYVFEEVTVFRFEEREMKINSITTKVKREPVSVSRL